MVYYDDKYKGNAIIIEHANGLYSGYYNMSHLIRTSGTVSSGEEIGKMGNTGLSYGTFLHFQMGRNGYANGNSMDPKDYLPGLSYKWR